MENIKELANEKLNQPMKNEGPSKRGRKTTKEVMENIYNIYEKRNPTHIRDTIHGWERENNHEYEEIKKQKAILDFIYDPRNTRGRLSLFYQSVNTYWKIKCVIANAMTNM